MPQDPSRRRSHVHARVLPARYRMVSELARGGMGVVYRAVDRDRQSEVAVKTLTPTPTQDLVAFLRFNREARTASSLKHANICEVYEVSSFRGCPYIVMELLQGETLKTRLARGECDAAFVLDVVRQTARGLAAAHARSIVHRDIKPANLFLTTDGIVKLLDFGLAKHFAAVDTVTGITVTQPGYTPGTVQYMSPEQLLGHRLDQRTDLFSLGIVAYELLTGRRPFTGATYVETITSILHRRPAPLPALPFAAEWNHILHRLIAREPEQRYASAAHLLEDLELFERVIQGETVSWPPRSTVGETVRQLSLAIVPFRTIHRRQETAEQKSDVDYFSYSLVDELTVSLSRIDGLRVVARTLASKITRPGKALERVGLQLHTDRLLTGTVKHVDDRFVIVVSLFDVRGNAVEWVKEYEAGAERLFQLRDQIVGDVTAELQLSPQATTATRATVPREPRNRQAFQLCLKGRFFWSRRYEDGLLKAVDCFREAIKLDPDLPIAHAGLADTFSFLGFYSLMRPRTAFERAEMHAREALRLDPALAEAHTSCGLVRLGGDWRWDAAADEFAKAIELDPTQALARIYLSWTHVLRDEINEAYEQAERAQDTDPLSPILNAGAAYTFFLSRSYERAIRECEKALEIDRDFLVARYVMALCKGQLGMHREAIRDLELTVKLSDDMVFYLALLGKMYADTGEKALVAKAMRVLDRFDEMRAAGRYVGPHAYVYVYAGLGRLDEAFEWQQKAFADGASPFNYLSPQLEILHGDPRFLDDLRAWNAGLPESAFVRKAFERPPESAGLGQPA